MDVPYRSVEEALDAFNLVPSYCSRSQEDDGPVLVSVTFCHQCKRWHASDVACPVMMEVE